MVALSNAHVPEVKVLYISSTLWEASTLSVCPSTFPFATVFPEDFVDPETGSSYPLPPSYDPFRELPSIQDFHAQCIYRLSVHIARPRWMPDKASVSLYSRTLPCQ